MASNVNRKRAVRRPPSKGRRVFADALRSAIEEAKATKSQAARWIGIGPRTLYAWLNYETHVNGELVLDCEQLGERFLRHVCAHKHAPSPVGYIARKRAPVTANRRAKARSRKGNR